MTKITCVKNDGEYSINIEGHAGYNPGMDIVCSACSVLGYTLTNALEDQDSDHKLISEDDGSFHIIFRPTEYNDDAVATIVNTIMLGYEMLAEQYPNNVEVEW